MAGTGLKTTQVDLLSGLDARGQRALLRHSKQHGIQLYGLDETLKALKTIDPTIRKNAQKRIRKVPAEVAKKTKAAVPGRPMRNWGGWSRRGGAAMGDVGALRWDERDVKTGIRVLTGGQKLNVRLVNRSGPGSVFEMAGTKNNHGTAMLGSRPRYTVPHPAGEVFTANLRSFGVAPRLLIKTWRDEKGITRTASEIGKVAKFAEEEVKRRIA